MSCFVFKNFARRSLDVLIRSDEANEGSPPSFGIVQKFTVSLSVKGNNGKKRWLSFFRALIRTFMGPHAWSITMLLLWSH